MIKTDFSQTNTHKKRFSPFFSIPTVLFGLNFGVLGAIANTLFYINFLGSFGLFFGQIFVLLCLVNRGLNAAIIAACISSTAAVFITNDAYLIVIFLLEMLFVHVSMRKGYFLFQSAMAYWLLIGIPLFLILHTLTSDISADLLFIGVVTLALNSLICVSIVAICCWFIPSHYIYEKYYTHPPQLSSLIFSLCMLIATLPAMIIALFFIWQSSIQNERTVEQALNNSILQLTTLTNIELQRHLESIVTISNILQNNPTNKLPPLMRASNKNGLLFDTIIATDRYGTVTHVAPERNNYTYPNVQKTNYYKQARESETAFFTDATIAPYSNEVFMVDFIAPILSSRSFNGIVLGSVLLSQLGDFMTNIVPNGYLYIVTDSKGRIIARTDALNLPLLANFTVEKYTNPLITKIPTLLLKHSEYLYQQNKTSNDWVVTLVKPSHEITSPLVNYFFLLIVATLFALSAFALIARSISRRITQPLVDIANNTADAELHPNVIKSSQVSSEMVKLTKRLIDSHKVMSNFHQQLSEQVHQKTKQLKQLNHELYSIAQKDSLTQLLNKASFNRLAIAAYRNCIRSRINFSLVFIDIDHFKLINDTHGHPFGDKCIVAVAKTIQKHCKRDTDIIGRYGGEEFIIMIVGGELNEHVERITLIKDDIQNMQIIKDSINVRMTISAGVCSVTKDFSIDYETLLQQSDNQLYISKREGRNKISSIIQ